LNIYDKYVVAFNGERKDGRRVEILSEENDAWENIYVYFAGWHGEIIDNTIGNVSANLDFHKKQDDSTISCSLYYSGGKLIACEYSASVKSASSAESISHDKIKAQFFREPLKINGISGTIDQIVFTEDTVELTVTAKSMTGKKEEFDCYITGWYSADNGTGLGPFLFTADTDDTNENKQKAVYKNTSSPSWAGDYFHVFMSLDLGGLELVRGKLYYDTSMSR